MTTYYRRLATLAFFAMLSFPTFAEEVEFIKDNVRVAIDRAASEGKLVFLDFWADYCSPCKLMEKYTFTDPSVIDRMNGGYVPVRINIETFDGYDLKTQYNVSLLPTIIVLNSKGKLVARFEESMSASKLTAILEKYDTKKNRIKFEKPKEEPVKPGFSKDFNIVEKPNVNTKPTVAPSKPAGNPTTMPVATSVAATRNSKENTPVTANNVTKPTEKPAFKAPLYGSTAPIAGNNPTIRPTKIAETPSSYNTVAGPRRAVEKASVAKAETTTSTRTTATNASTSAASNKAMAAVSFTKGNFTLQVGNFASKDNADKMSAMVKTQLDGKQKVFLISGGSEDSKTHRVMVGGFRTHKEATEFKKQNQIDGFVQSYSKFMK